MSSLNFIGGEKGGVGKSVAARALAQYFIDREQPFTGFDTDRSHTSFTRFYADYASPVIVADAGHDSVDLLGRLLTTYGTGPGYVVLRNHGRGSDFSQLDKSPAMAKARELAAYGIDLPALHETSMRKIDRHDMSFWAAIHDRSSPDCLGMLERQRVKTWLRNTYASFDALPL